jgi:transposase-like protein
MERKRVQDSEACPHCGGTSVRKNGRNRGRQRWLCGDCGKSFGETFGTPLYGLHTPAAEIARTLLIVMRRGSLRAAEEISGHKWETIKEWLLRAREQAEVVTDALVTDLELDEVEVDAFWSFVGNAVQTLQRGQARHRGWTRRRSADRAGAA